MVFRLDQNSVCTLKKHSCRGSWNSNKTENTIRNLTFSSFTSLCIKLYIPPFRLLPSIFCWCQVSYSNGSSLYWAFLFDGFSQTFHKSESNPTGRWGNKFLIYSTTRQNSVFKTSDFSVCNADDAGLTICNPWYSGQSGGRSLSLLDVPQNTSSWWWLYQGVISVICSSKILPGWSDPAFVLRYSTNVIISL